MTPDPATDLQQHIGDIVYTAIESARLGYLTDPHTATDIATGNIMAAVYAARPAIAPQAPQYPPQQEERRPRHGWGRDR